MELYNVPRNSFIRVGTTVLLFDHIDGMYSFCTDRDGGVIHLAAWTEVEVVEGWDVEQNVKQDVAPVDIKKVSSSVKNVV